MTIIPRIYYFLHRLGTPHHERDSKASPGYWQYTVRTAALSLCRTIAGRILDVGCGDGLFLRQLFAQNPEAHLWAIDIDEKNIRKAHETLDKPCRDAITFSVQNAEDLSFQDNFFNAVVCINLLMCLDSPDSVKKVLTSICRVCEKGGYVIFEIRNSRNPLLRLKYKLAPYYDKTLEDRQITMQDPRVIDGWLRESNMTITEKKHIGFPVSAFAPIIIYKVQKL